MKIPGVVFNQLFELWEQRERRDEFLGTLFNAWIEKGGCIIGTRAGHTYVDVGTIHGYREAIHLLSTEGRIFSPQPSRSLVPSII
jgi:tRNA (mo5U34)-methyltransferase